MPTENKTSEASTVATGQVREELLARAGDLAQQRFILEALDKSLKAHGFAGSTKIPLLVYLAAITRMFDDPVSLVIKGQSGSGKSFSLHSGLRYVPKTSFHEFHGMSEKALVHAKDINFSNRLLVVQELAGMAKGGLVFLRQLLTEGEVKYLSVAQTRDGHQSKEHVTIKGPTGALITTTKENIYWEDETRMLSLHVDQSLDQIDRSIMAFAETRSKPTDAELAPWHALHDYVCSGPLGVVIPYKRELLTELPRTHMRIVRDIPKLFALIRAHALLQQCTRSKRENNVVATPEDYRVVSGLIADALAHGLKIGVPTHIAEVVTAALAVCAEKQRPVTQFEVAQHLGRDQANVGRNLNVAVKEGYLKNESQGQGRSHAYEPGDRELPSSKVLPHPNQLRIRIEEGQRRLARSEQESMTGLTPMPVDTAD